MITFYKWSSLRFFKCFSFSTTATTVASLSIWWMFRQFRDGFSYCNFCHGECYFDQGGHRFNVSCTVTLLSPTLIVSGNTSELVHPLFTDNSLFFFFMKKISVRKSQGVNRNRADLIHYEHHCHVFKYSDNI